jgi:transcriptional regulator with XRE-family HTH domain
VSRPAWPRLGRLVRERREALRISQGAAGLSASTWRKVEKAVDPPYRRSTLLAIAGALRWAPESIDRILAGGDPVETGALHALAPSVDLDDPDERDLWALTRLSEQLRWKLIQDLREERGRRAG